MFDARRRRLALGGQQERSDAARICRAVEVLRARGPVSAALQRASLATVEYVAAQVKVDAGKFAAGYAFSDRTVEYHRAQIRAALGFREATCADEERLSAWLADEVCPSETDDDR